MKKRKNIITVAIDSPAAAGAGTQAKLIAKHYDLLYLDTGKIYRFVGKLKLQYPKKYNYSFIRKKIKKLKIKDLKKKELLSDDVATSASIIAKDIKIYGNPNLNLKGNYEMKNFLKDHRVFMMSCIAALTLGGNWKINDKDSINTSFPKFLNILKYLGAKINWKKEKI